MKKIKDLSKVIGIVKRGGVYSPSNDRSEEKLKTVLIERGFDLPAALVFDEIQISVLRDQARQVGFSVRVIERGANR